MTVQAEWNLLALCSRVKGVGKSGLKAVGKMSSTKGKTNKQVGQPPHTHMKIVHGRCVLLQRGKGTSRSLYDLAMEDMRVPAAAERFRRGRWTQLALFRIHSLYHE